MIVVEIIVPSVGGSYEFKLNEDVSVSLIIDEMCSVICEREQYAMFADTSDMMLFNADTGVQLAKSLSLYENNIDNGSKLMLV